MAQFKDNPEVGSKWWVLQAIKSHKNTSGTGYLVGNKGVGLNFYDAKEMAAELEQAGYIRNEQLDSSKPPKYYVTSFGHRYLEQQGREETAQFDNDQDVPRQVTIDSELAPAPAADPARTALQVDQGKSHPVPEAPTFTPRLYPESTTPKPHPWKIHKPVVTPKPVEKEPQKQLPVGPEPKLLNVQPNPTPSFLEQFKAVAGVVVLDKFSDQVTVKDIIEFLEKEN